MNCIVVGLRQNMNLEMGTFTTELVLRLEGGEEFVAQISEDTASKIVGLHTGRGDMPLPSMEQEPDPGALERTFGGDYVEPVPVATIPAAPAPPPAPAGGRIPGQPVPARTVPKDEMGYPVVSQRSAPAPEDDFDGIELA